ncbi:MAG: glycoside hydrolase family 3 C-terminal domain-containing protein [Lachnospiraceae bacterium]|nr:glycoside hydrolase family 3 C-terminal domain-containing protein [Lachnospiraceae bacterium]
MEKWARLLYQPALPLYKGKRVTASIEHTEVSRRAATEGMVLLKNKDAALPLNESKGVVLFGKASVEYIKGGGGSGDVFCEYVRSLYDGLSIRKVKVFEPLIDFYKKNLEGQYKKGYVPGMTVEPTVDPDMLKEAKSFSDTAIIVFNRYSAEGWDRSNVECNNEFNPWPSTFSLPKLSEEVFPEGDFYLSLKEEELINTVSENFKTVIAVLNSGGVTDCRWIRDNDNISAALYMGQAGMEGGIAAADILIGRENPSGRLADTIAEKLSDYPSTEGFHDSFDYVEYTDDIYVGYRYFETIPEAYKKVVYPFGFGLSYTSFSEETVMAKETKDGFDIDVKVKNTGAFKGKNVVAIYVKAPKGKLGKAERVLVGFKKTKELLPGEETLLSFHVTKYSFASFDDLGKVSDASYVLEAGTYEFYVGANVRTAKKIDFEFVLNKDEVLVKLTHKLTPTELSKRLLCDGSYLKLEKGPHKNINESLLERQDPGSLEAVAPEVRAMGRHLLMRTIKEGKKPLKDVYEGKITVDEFINQLDDDELIHILGGQPNTGVGNVYGFGNLPEYGIPNAQMADGPAGVRILKDTGVVTTAFPSATVIANTWNEEIAKEVGFAGGEEIKENNLSIWLTPAVNIHRNPMCGRNFEYYSEDPYLAGKLAGSMVKGIQENEVGASVKHFACNNKETNRKHSDSRVSERAIREIYLKAFEIIVNDANPYTIMSSYNAINGVRTSENKELLTDILRGEWHYEGLVMTDWWCRSEHYKEILAGNDLKMATGYPERVKRAMDMGAIKREDLIISAKRVVETMLKL